jgi:transposase
MRCPRTRAPSGLSATTSSTSGVAPCAGAANGIARHGRAWLGWPMRAANCPGYPTRSHLSASASKDPRWSRMRESARAGAFSNGRPYRDPGGYFVRARSHFLTCRDYGAADWIDRRSGETMQVLEDAQWARFEAAIAAANIRGARPRREDRRTIEAIIWRIDNGAKWRSIPAELGDCHRHMPICASAVGWSAGYGTRSWPISRGTGGNRNWDWLASTAPSRAHIRRRPVRGLAKTSVESAIHSQHRRSL